MSYSEGTVEDDEPRELVEISINDGVTVYRLTSASQDIVYGGQVYTATAIERSELPVVSADNDAAIELLLPLTHPLAIRYPAQASPPDLVTVLITRLMGADARTQFEGEILSMSAEGAVAKFRVPSRTSQSLMRPVLTFALGDSCVHQLFDSGCGVSESGSFGGLAHRVTCTVLAVNGRDVRVDLASTDRNGTWALFGKITHALSGNKRTIVAQTDQDPGVTAVATLRMMFPIPELKVGHSVTVTIGCPKTIVECGELFGNRQAHLGWPLKPARELSLPTSGGFRR